MDGAWQGGEPHVLEGGGEGRGARGDDLGRSEVCVAQDAGQGDQLVVGGVDQA